MLFYIMRNLCLQQEEYEDSDEEEPVNVDEEHRLKAKIDSDNIKVEVMVLGDAVHFPVHME